MKNKEVAEGLNDAFKKITPDVFDKVIEECEVPMNMKESYNQPTRSRFSRTILALTGCLLVFVCVGFLFRPVANASIITLDVNPGIEIHLNDDNASVEKVIPLNEDAQVVLADLDLNNKSLDTAVDEILTSMLDKGYLSEDKNSILLSIDCDDQQFNSIKTNVATDIDNFLKKQGIDVSLISQAIIEDDLAESLVENKDISVGKAQLINKIMKANPKYDEDDLAKLNVNDLNLLLQNPHLDVDDIEISGVASDGLYIGRDNAKNKALTYMRLSEVDVKDLEVELELEDGVMVYEVEYEYNNQEYEVLVNASNGEVIASEIDDDLEDEISDNDIDIDEDDDDDDIIPEGNYIEKTEAVDIALKNAGFDKNAVKDLKAELDFEDKYNKVIYEVEFKIDGLEYEYDIDATNATILDVKSEVDD